MSKAHAKQQAPSVQADQDRPAPQEAGAAAAADHQSAAAPAVVLPAEASQAEPNSPAPDAHHGRGGLYTMKDGRRVLIAQTQPETTKDRK